MNGSVNIYDIKKDFKGKDQEYLASTSEFANGSGVNDIEWVPNHDSIFTTVDEEGWVKLYDTRTKDVSVVSNKLGDIGINSCSINPTNQSFIAIGDSIGQVKVFDLRMEAVVDELAQFDGSITQLKWHPKFHNILAGSAADNKVKIFNLQREDDKVLFVHGGHMLGVNDFDWCLHDDWLMTSVADDNSLHVWKPSSNIVSEYKQ